MIVFFLKGSTTTKDTRVTSTTGAGAHSTASKNTRATTTIGAGAYSTATKDTRDHCHHRGGSPLNRHQGHEGHCPQGGVPTIPPPRTRGSLPQPGRVPTQPPPRTRAEFALHDDLIIDLGDIWVMKNVNNNRKKIYYSSFHMRLAPRLRKKKDEAPQEALKTGNFDLFMETSLAFAYSDSFELRNYELHHPSTPVKLRFDISRLVGLMKKIATAHPCDQLTVGAVTQRTQKDQGKN